MAKTSSQIAAERKLVSDYRNAVHQQQMAGVAEKNAARTLAVLRKGIAGTSDPVKKAELSRAAQSVTDGYKQTVAGQKKSGPKTVQDLQKKKEDRAEGLFGTEAERKARDARKALQEYTLTDEYKKNQKKIQQDQYVKGILFGIKPEYEADDKEKQLQKDLDYWDGQVQQERDAKTTQRDMAAMESWSDEDKAALEQYISDRETAFVQSFSPFATGLPADYESNPLIAKYGRARLDQIASSYQRMKNQQEYEAAQQTGRESADKGAIAAIGANAASIGANLADTLLNPLERIAQGAVGRDDRYSTLDPYAGGQAAAYASGVRDETAKNIAGSEEGVQVTDGITGREALALGYQGGMSAADSVARGLIGGTPVVGAGLAALGSFNQTLRQASEQGASPEQAVKLATVNSALEMATEKLPLDELFKVAKGGAKPAAKVIGNILKQAGIEIAEEEASLIGTTLAEAAILQEKSDYNQRIMIARIAGATQEQAKARANRALLAEAIHTAIVSGISGAASGAGAEYAAASYVGTPETEVQTEAQEQMPDQMQQGTQEAQSQPEQDNWMAKTFREAMGEKQKTAASEKAAVTTKSASKGSGAYAEGGQVKGTGAAERNFSGVAAYEDMLADDNVQRQRPGAVRDVEMPKKDSDGRRVTEFSSNVVSAGVTPDPMADAIKSLVGDKKLSFDTRTNKQSLENAADAIREQGDTAVISALHTNAENKTIVDGDIEKGLVLYAQYANDPDPKSQETASQIILDMGAIANMSGRNLQLFSLMKRMTPEGQLMTVRKNIEKSIADINKGRSAGKQIVYVPGQKKMDAAKTVAQKRKVEIDQALEQNFLDAKTDEQRKAALDDIYKNVAVQIKPTLGEAWDAWRNLAMLGNFKTHERNFVSTAAFKPYTTVKRAIGTALESVFLKQENRTKSLVGISKEAHDLADWAKKDAKSEDVKRLLGGAGTAGDDARSAIQDYRKILPGALDTVRKKNLQLMEAADFVFKRSEYAVSLATFLKARGYNIKQVQAGQVPRGVLDAGRQYAVREAQKATFNDRNKLSDTLSKLNQLAEEKGGPTYHIISKGIFPFLKAPANIVARVAEYNPVALGKTLLTAKADIDSGRKSAADVIDEISAGLTGSAAMVLGAALRAGMVPGIKLVGAIEDEDELREGAQAYSIQIGDRYYSVAWLAPAMIPLFIGANLYDKFSNMDDAVDGWDAMQAFAEATAGSLNPMLELSMLSSLSDIVQKVKYEETPGDMVMTALLNAATSYFTQGIPTVFGQIEQATETEKKSTYVNTDNKVERMVKTAVSGATKRLPGDLYQTTKRDEWGEPVKNPDDWTSQAFNAFFNPVTTSTRKTDEVTKEITRLNKSQPESVTPPTASKTISYTDRQGNAHKDVRLTEEQYQTLAETQGKTAKAILENMINSKDYAALTDAQKAEAIRTAYSYARKTGEMAAIGKNHTGYDEAWMMEMEQGKEAEYIIRKAVRDNLNGAMESFSTARKKKYDTTTAENEMQWAYDAFKAMSEGARSEISESADSSAANYIEARDAGVSHDKYLDVSNLLVGIVPEKGKKEASDIQKSEAIMKTSGLTAKQKELLVKQQVSDAQDKNIDELKALGYAADKYVKLYRDYLDYTKGNGKKKRTIEKWMQDYNITYSVAEKLYEVFP